MKETSGDTMQELREKIEQTDREIVRLLNERAAVSIEIGKTKRAAGREVYDPSREAVVYRHLEEFNDGILSEAALRGVFREILSASRFLQTPTTVAFLGPEASFSHQAALAHFGGGIAAVPTATIPEVFDKVERGKGQWGIVPVENSAEGSVKATLDRLISTPLAIRAEVYLRVRHCLLASCDDLDAIRKIYSHPQALAQCQVWLRTNLPGVPLVEVDSTAGAARRVKEDKRAAAVASCLAAETYGLNLLAEGIEDNPAQHDPLSRHRTAGGGKGRGDHRPGQDLHPLRDAPRPGRPPAGARPLRRGGAQPACGSSPSRCGTGCGNTSSSPISPGTRPRKRRRNASPS